jgi:hypothetical protein
MVNMMEQAIFSLPTLLRRDSKRQIDCGKGQ